MPKKWEVRAAALYLLPLRPVWLLAAAARPAQSTAVQAAQAPPATIPEEDKAAAAAADRILAPGAQAALVAFLAAAAGAAQAALQQAAQAALVGVAKCASLHTVNEFLEKIMRPLHLTNSLLLLSVLTLLGCSALGTVQEKAEDAAARGVRQYCANFPYDVRKNVIEPGFKQAIAPDEADIRCYGDPDNPKP